MERCSQIIKNVMNHRTQHSVTFLSTHLWVSNYKLIPGKILAAPFQHHREDIDPILKNGWEENVFIFNKLLILNRILMEDGFFFLVLMFYLLYRLHRCNIVKYIFKPTNKQRIHGNIWKHINNNWNFLTFRYLPWDFNTATTQIHVFFFRSCF